MTLVGALRLGSRGRQLERLPRGTPRGSSLRRRETQVDSVARTGGAIRMEDAGGQTTSTMFTDSRTERRGRELRGAATRCSDLSTARKVRRRAKRSQAEGRQRQ